MIIVITLCTQPRYIGAMVELNAAVVDEHFDIETGVQLGDPAGSQLFHLSIQIRHL